MQEMKCFSYISLCYIFQLQNLKNENSTLKQRLEELVTKLQHQEDKRKDKEVKRPERENEEEKEVVRGVQGSESHRGEGEGRIRVVEEKEKRGEIIGTRREAGVGEEVLHLQGGRCDEEIKTKRRGEAEGGQKEKEKQEKESEPRKEEASGSTEIHKPPVGDNTETTDARLAGCSLSGPEVELLTNQLQVAQEEADRQAMVAQDLRSKLGEQSKRTWEAEQRLVLLDSELQRLKKAAESLVEARRQIEVQMTAAEFD